MADIELIIKIPKNTYRQIQALARNGYFEHDICGNSMRRIANGTPLPKGHGRLIDADRLKEEMEKDVRRAMSFVDLTDFVWLAPTIIEKDKEQEDGHDG